MSQPRVMLRQADGHPAVALRAAVGEKVQAMVPNGTVGALVGREGEHVRIELPGGARGVVKARNVRLIVQKPSARPAPAAPAAPATRAVVAPPPAPLEASAQMSFTVNGKAYTVDPSQISVDLSVHDWLAQNVPSAAPRRSCGVGRCGACVCMLTSAGGESRSFNACLRPVLSCNGMAVTTGAAIGTAAKPHPIQKTMASQSATQCGFCSVGVVMNLYAKLAAGLEPTAANLDKALDANYCRCTGYRPILSAYRSFAGSDGRALCPAPAVAPKATRLAGAGRDGQQWIEAGTEADLQAALEGLRKAGTKDYFLVGGHTTKGLWPERRASAYVSIGDVASLRACSASAAGVELGAAATLTACIEVLRKAVAARGGEGAPGTAALAAMARHAVLSPGSHIRNVGTVGGNVMIGFEHQKGTPFPTEWPLLLIGAGATVTLWQAGQTRTIPLADLWTQNLQYAYLQKFTIPYSADGDVVATYRTAQRHVYSETFAAAMLGANVSGGQIRSASVLFNGVGPVPLRLPQVEEALRGAPVSDEARFQAAAQVLDDNLQRVKVGAFRRQLCVAYFYKFFLKLQPTLPQRLQSGAESWLEKEVTSGKQTFDVDRSVAPLNEPIPKIDGLKQCTGEVQYVQNLPVAKGTLHAAPVLATQVGRFTLDTSAAAKLKGFAGVVTAKDVPDNSGLLIADGESKFLGHPLALVLADTPGTAVEAARLVAVGWSGTKGSLILDCDDAIRAKSFFDAPAAVKVGDTAKEFAASDKVFEGTWKMGAQYHFHMETHSCYTVPSPEGTVEVHSATQMPTAVAGTVAKTLGGLAHSDVVVKNKRCGGGFGGKLGNSLLSAQLCAVAAWAQKAPVSLVYEQADNMRAMGLRPDWRINYKVGCTLDGKIRAVSFDCYVAGGQTNGVGFSCKAFLESFDNCYNVAAWDVKVTPCKTDLPPNTSMRAPGWLPAIYAAERVVTEVAAAVNLEPHNVRQANFYQKNDVTPVGLKLSNWNLDQLWQAVQQSSSFAERSAAVKAYNAQNRWTKKGLSLVASKFAVGYGDASKHCDAFVRVNRDGTVSVMCGGTEIGQGLTTKVAQTVAYELGIDVTQIRILDQDTTVIGAATGASDVTGGSVTSELTGLAAANACSDINAALQPVRRLLPGGSWAEVVAKAYELGIALKSTRTDDGVVKPRDAAGQVYNTYGVVALEATVDVLTGQVDFSRADIIYDLGRSVNPAVDVGQIEGAFVMGLGLAMTESVTRDAAGLIKWNDYVLPTPWEIPTELNVALAHGVPNPDTVGGGKAIGEPPITMTYAAVEAVQLAINAANDDAGARVAPAGATPLTVADRKQLLAVPISQMKLH